MHIKAEHILVTGRAGGHFPPTFYHLTDTPAYSLLQLESMLRLPRVDLNLQMCVQTVAGAAIGASKNRCRTSTRSKPRCRFAMYQVHFQVHCRLKDVLQGSICLQLSPAAGLTPLQFYFGLINSHPFYFGSDQTFLFWSHECCSIAMFNL